MQSEAPSKSLALDDPLLLPKREVHAEIGINSKCGKTGYVLRKNSQHLVKTASSGIVTGQAQETESRSNKERRKQRGVWTKSASRGQNVGFVVMSTDTFGKF